MYSPVPRSNYSISMIIWCAWFCVTVCDIASWITVSVRMNYLCLLLRVQNISGVSESKYFITFFLLHFLRVTSYVRNAWSYVASILKYFLWENTLISLRRNKQIGKPTFHRWVNYSSIYSTNQILSNFHFSPCIFSIH